MTELEKIAYAKSFIDKLANGINPIDNSPAPDDDIINNVRLSRCFFYVSDVLKQVIDNGGIFPECKPIQNEKKRSGRARFVITPQQIQNFEYSESPITSTELIERITACVPAEDLRKFPRKKLTRWLLCLDLIEYTVRGMERIIYPTASGEEIGISAEERNGTFGIYYAILFNLDAQHFVIDNIEAMLTMDTQQFRQKMNLDNQCKRWELEENERLVELYNEGRTVSEIAKELKRGEMSIKTRLRKNGIFVDVPPYTVYSTDG